MRIGGFLPTTLLDYPGHLACTVFTMGCDLRCPFCHNGELVLPEHFPAPLDEEEVLAHIRKRSKLLEGVCISGGEPTLQPDLKDFAQKLKDLGLLVKLDTNGRDTELVKELLREGLIDMVAMDLKADRDSYPLLCGLPGMDPAPYFRTAEFLLSSSYEYEFRTTLVKGLHSAECISNMSGFLSKAEHWYLQSYAPGDNVTAFLTDSAAKPESFDREELHALLRIAQEKMPRARLRGIE